MKRICLDAGKTKDDYEKLLSFMDRIGHEHQGQAAHSRFMKSACRVRMSCNMNMSRGVKFNGQQLQSEDITSEARPPGSKNAEKTDYTQPHVSVHVGG
jgi:hypothetical protein